jgi:hypothetical protein
VYSTAPSENTSDRASGGRRDSSGAEKPGVVGGS